MGALTVLGASSGFGAFSLGLTVDQGYAFYSLMVLAGVLVSCASMHETRLKSTPENSNAWDWHEIRACYYVSPTRHRDFFLVFVSRTMYYMAVSVQTFMLFYFRCVCCLSPLFAFFSWLYEPFLALLSGKSCFGAHRNRLLLLVSRCLEI